MARRRLFSTLKAKLISAVLICFVCVGFPTLIILYSYMNSLVFGQVRRVNLIWAEDAVDEVNRSLSAVVEAVSWSCFNENIKKVMRYSEPLSSSQMLDVFAAQDSLSAYMAGSPAWNDMNKMVVFNDSGVSFTFTKGRYGTLQDVDLIRLRNKYDSIEFETGSYVRLMTDTTLNSPYENAVVAYGRMDDIDAYIYAEMSMSIFDPLFDNAPVENIYVIRDEDGFCYPGDRPEGLLSGSYAEERFDLDIDGVSFVYYENRLPLSIGSYGLGIFVLLIVVSFVLITVISYLTSRYLTRSTVRLVRHISHLSDSGSYGEVNPMIEEGNDEMAEIGRTVNRMSLSIKDLLERNERLYEEKKENEFSMLQMQVNPHFLYNTLESIHYLAQVQKADGIASMSRGLSHLLKNIAKGNGQKITLADELRLVSEYDEIQQVRYMGMYEIVCDIDESHMDCLIQKFTLQPLVENAIFHGIEPKGEGGTIRIRSEHSGSFLDIFIEDDGIGMDEATLQHIFDEKAHFKGNMTGVGVRNVNERLRMCYGEECGLRFESEPGKGTTACVRILFEKES